MGSSKLNLTKLKEILKSMGNTLEKIETQQTSAAHVIPVILNASVPENVNQNNNEGNAGLTSLWIARSKPPRCSVSLACRLQKWISDSYCFAAYAVAATLLQKNCIPRTGTSQSWTMTH
jgi:hypothetical protein